MVPLGIPLKPKGSGREKVGHIGEEINTERIGVSNIDQFVVLLPSGPLRLQSLPIFPMVASLNFGCTLLEPMQDIVPAQWFHPLDICPVSNAKPPVLQPHILIY